MKLQPPPKLLMDIEKLLAKQRQMTGKPLSPTGDEGGKPSAQLGGTKQQMKIAPTGATPIGRVNDIIGY